jgi:hypothetical protein
MNKPAERKSWAQFNENFDPGTGVVTLKNISAEKLAKHGVEKF